MVQSTGEFAQQLRILREAQGLSMRGLAGLIGVSSVTVWKWEKGGSKPRARMIAPLARALDVSPRQLQSPGKVIGRTMEVAATDALGAVDAVADGQGVEAVEETASSGSTEPLSDVIARAKQMIAEASGTGSNNITILIEY